jgi:hypothetical protein
MPTRDLTLVVVGAGKAASTTIFGWLDAHPQVCMAHPKEPQFFSCHYDVGPAAFWPPFFSHCSGEPHVGEATPSYLHLPYVPQRIAATYPAAKILMCMRHPVDRAYSDWWMHHARGDDRESFERAMRISVEQSDRRSGDAEASWKEHLASLRSGRVRARPYLEIGLYDEHLARYREYFPEDQIKVVLFDELRQNSRQVYTDVCRFLKLSEPAEPPKEPRNQALSIGLGRARRVRYSAVGAAAARWIPQSIRTAVKNAIAGRGGGPPPMPIATRTWLLEYYAAHNDRLGRMLGVDLAHWNR